MGLVPHPSPYSALALPFPLLYAWERLEAVPLRGGYVMNPGPVFLPLTTRGRHLPSSWSHFPKLLTPVTHHTLTCSPLSRPLYSLLTNHSAWINCMCYCVVYCGTLWSMFSRTPALRCVLWCLVLFSV